MKKESVFKRVLALVVVIAMLSSLAIPAMAADAADVIFTQVDNSSVSANPFDREAAKLPEKENAYKDTDTVRVSIFLDRESTLEAGYDADTAGTNYFAKQYRKSLEKDQNKLINKIEKATGNKLDVVWNLTLAANLISANVPYGQIKQIEAMAGVRTVVIETLYTPDVFLPTALTPTWLPPASRPAPAPLGLPATPAQVPVSLSSIPAWICCTRLLTQMLTCTLWLRTQSVRV